MEEREFLEEFVYPKDVLGDVGECNILSFCAQKSDDGLFLGTPRDGSETDKVGEPRNGVTVKLESPLGIRKPSDGGVAS